MPLVIPSAYAGLPITGIAEYGFSAVSLQTWQNYYQLTTVTVPDSVTNIGDEAFFYSPVLTSVWIGNGVSGIGHGAFASCTNLTSIYFAGNAPSLGSQVFDSDDAVTLYYLPGATGWGPTFGGRPTVLWDLQHQLDWVTNNGLITITKYNGPGGALTIPDTINGQSVIRIDNSAFSGWANLTSVTIPDGVTSIGDSAFANCGVASLQIPDTVISIGDYAFSSCTSLTNAVIPNGVTRIATGQFYGCSSLTTFTIANTVTNIGDYAFSGCTGLTNVTVPDSITSIANGVFDGCTGLTAFAFPSAVFSIGNRAFLDCSSLTKLIIPQTVTNIGNNAFEGCNQLTAFTIPSSVAYIGDMAFSFCQNLTAIEVDASNAAYRSLDGVLFDKNRTTLIQYPCAKAGPYTVPDTITSIGVVSFANCYRLTGITIPDSVTNIGLEAFYGTWLKTATIPNSVTSISPAAFMSNPYLSRVTIGSGIIEIDDNAFLGCSSLAEVYFKGNAPSLGSSVFDYVMPTVYYLPGTTGWGATFGGRPTALWVLPNSVILNFGSSFGVGPSGFGFIVSWATNNSVVVEANTSLAGRTWLALQTNTLNGGWCYFSDQEWTNYPARFYRVRWP
jgi:hypothetical protein